jgi:hypothetical protein
MRKRLKVIIELISIGASVFALAREMIAGLKKADPSPEQQSDFREAKKPVARDEK